MNVVNPKDLKTAKLNKDNSLVQEAVDFFNATLINRRYETLTKESSGCYAIEVGMYQFSHGKTLDAAIECIKEAGWKVYHGRYYSLQHACPSWAIFVDAEQVEEAIK